MKRLLASLVFVAAISLAQEHAAQPEHASEPAHGEAHGEGHGGDPFIWWKWANFAILAGALGYMIKKNAGPFFSGRTDEIQKGLLDATRLKQEAEANMAEIERRMQNLEAEIGKMRQRSRDEMAAEGERLKMETTQHLAKIQANAEQEIAMAAKAARQELKAFSANLAVSLAAQKIRQQVTPEVQDGMVRAFLSGVEGRAN